MTVLADLTIFLLSAIVTIAAAVLMQKQDFFAIVLASSVVHYLFAYYYSANRWVSFFRINNFAAFSVFAVAVASIFADRLFSIDLLLMAFGIHHCLSEMYWDDKKNNIRGRFAIALSLICSFLLIGEGLFDILIPRPVLWVGMGLGILIFAIQNWKSQLAIYPTVLMIVQATVALIASNISFHPRIGLYGFILYHNLSWFMIPLKGNSRIADFGMAFAIRSSIALGLTFFIFRWIFYAESVAEAYIIQQVVLWGYLHIFSTLYTSVRNPFPMLQFRQ